MHPNSISVQIDALADAVAADWRWVRDDLSVSVLGMLLYGLAMSIARDSRLTAADTDAAVLKCMTDHVGAAAKWSGGLVDEARLSADDANYHPGQFELIGVGQTYHSESHQRAVVDNVFANFASVRQRAGLPDPMVVVFLNPLAVLLAELEREKGAPLTEDEVLEVHDTAACTQMRLTQAERFYASLDAQIPIPRLNPDRIWDEWQMARRRLD